MTIAEYRNGIHIARQILMTHWQLIHSTCMMPCLITMGINIICALTSYIHVRKTD